MRQPKQRKERKEGEFWVSLVADQETDLGDSWLGFGGCNRAVGKELRKRKRGERRMKLTWDRKASLVAELGFFFFGLKVERRKGYHSKRKGESEWEGAEKAKGEKKRK